MIDFQKTLENIDALEKEIETLNKIKEQQQKTLFFSLLDDLLEFSKDVNIHRIQTYWSRPTTKATIESSILVFTADQQFITHLKEIPDTCFSEPKTKEIILKKADILDKKNITFLNNKEFNILNGQIESKLDTNEDDLLQEYYLFKNHESLQNSIKKPNQTLNIKI